MQLASTPSPKPPPIRSPAKPSTPHSGCATSWRKSRWPTSLASTCSASANITAGLLALRAADHAGGGGRAHQDDQALHGRHRAQLGRSGARLSAVRDPRPSVRRPRRDHGRARLVHRVASRCSATTSTTTTSCSRRSSSCCCRSATASASPGQGRHRAPLDDQRGLSAHAGSKICRSGSRSAAIRRRPSRAGVARPADGARHHRRHAGALRAVRRICSARPRAQPATTGNSCRSASTPTAMSPTPRSGPPTSSSRATPRR